MLSFGMRNPEAVTVHGSLFASNPIFRRMHLAIPL
jgi:hypothetical protein